MKKIIRLTESDLVRLVEKVTLETKMVNEIYSDKDMERGEEIGKSKYGLELKFPKDFRRDKLIIKKLVRLKSKIEDEQLKSEIDNILDMLEGVNDIQDIDESSTKKHKAQKLIDNILSTQGKKTDQRPVDKRKIYKEDELSSMDYDQIHGIWQKIHHPAGRGW